MFAKQENGCHTKLSEAVLKKFQVIVQHCTGEMESRQNAKSSLRNRNAGVLGLKTYYMTQHLVLEKTWRRPATQ